MYRSIHKRKEEFYETISNKQGGGFNRISYLCGAVDAQRMRIDAYQQKSAHGQAYNIYLVRFAADLFVSHCDT